MFKNSKYVHEKYSWIKFKRNNENGKRKKKQKNRKKNSGKMETFVWEGTEKGESLERMWLVPGPSLRSGT